MTDTVSVTNLCLHGHHGVMPEETRLGQKFYVDIDCDLDLSLCARDDDYSKAVCYGALCDTAAQSSDNGPYKLIETLAEHIAQDVLAQFPAVSNVVVRVRKPSAPIAATLDHVQVTLHRARRYRVAFSLGSNIGDKAANLRNALAWLNTVEGLEIDQASKFYRTAPWGEEDQDWFLNACATGWSTRKPIELLKALKRIELEIGREPGARWGPRLIDIDFLFADDLELDVPLLTLPHREMFNRAFVLVPLAEIAADQTVLGRNIGNAAKTIDYDPNEITPID